MPSTLLNIIDLLADWRSVTQKNEDVSKIYILYQVFPICISTTNPIF